MTALRSVALAAALATAALVGSAAQAAPYCGGQAHQNSCGRPNIYPCCDNGSNCTWWAWESACRNWGVGLVNWGNANTWGGHANVDPNFDLVGYPVVGSIATSTRGNYGHVAWVVGGGGGTAVVTEQNCCPTCSGNTRQANYSASYFNSGYVIRHGSLCQCAAGQTQTQGCGNCGTQVRGCSNGCNWDGFGACNGPDPAGGTQVCSNGGVGVCSDARQRCIGGWLSCQSLTSPSAESCDGLDNDCNGSADDGHPPLGANPPAFAATLADVSWPRTLKAGERASVWAEFRNVGTTAWAAGSIWLRASGSADGASVLNAQGTWPAWNVASVLKQPVAPGDSARFSFEIEAPPTATGVVEESFDLQTSTGQTILCPQPDIHPSIHVLPVNGADPGTDGGTSESTSSVSGCASVPGAGLVLPLFFLAALRRRKTVRS